MDSKTFNVSFPAKLLEQVDESARKQYGSRSDFLRAAVIEKLNREQEWKEIFRYGKEIGSKLDYPTEEEVADAITAERRKYRLWLKK